MKTEPHTKPPSHEGNPSQRSAPTFSTPSVPSVHSVVNNSAFSLVELLVVIAIIGMMVGLSALAVSGMRAPAVQHGADQVMSGLSLARQIAITKNTQAALLIADRTSTGFPTNGPYRHWSVVFSNKGANTWTIAKDWEELPNGAVFSQILENARTNNSFPASTSPGSAITASFYPISNTNYTSTFSNISSGNSTLTATNTPSIRFNSSGVASGNATLAGSVGIRISPGTAMGGNATITSTNQYYIIEADHTIGRIRMRAPESY
jgi:prepilin-type N-terminal cleavage/methylation domain-containing protein